MSIKHPELKNPVPANLHEMIREKCTEYFDELESELGDIESGSYHPIDTIKEIEGIFEEKLAEIGKAVLTVHYQEDYDRFVRELKAQAETEEE